MLKGFQAFVARGNVMDLAVGVVLGAAFGKIVSALVEQMLNPVLGLLTGQLSFARLYVALSTEQYESIEAAKAAGVPVIVYGAFLDAVIQFVIVGFALYVVVQQMNRLRPPPPAAPATTRECPECLGAIPLKAKRCQHCASAVTPIAA